MPPATQQLQPPTNLWEERDNERLLAIIQRHKAQAESLDWSVITDEFNEGCENKRSEDGCRSRFRTLLRKPQYRTILSRYGLAKANRLEPEANAAAPRVSNLIKELIDLSNAQKQLAPRRAAQAAKAHSLQTAAPKVSSQEEKLKLWETREDDRLLKILKRHKFPFNWGTITQEYNRDAYRIRTQDSCRSRFKTLQRPQYQSILEKYQLLSTQLQSPPPLDTRKVIVWSKAENQKLLDIIKRYTAPLPWPEIVKELKKATSQERSEEACRIRYRMLMKNVPKPAAQFKMDFWQPAEDRMLIRLSKKRENDPAYAWSQIASDLHKAVNNSAIFRTEKACCSRYKLLQTSSQYTHYWK